MIKWTFRLLQPFLIMALTFIVGIIGYMAIEKYDFLEAVYMTTITITTVGFSEVKPLSDAGRVFTIAMLITSLGTFAFAISRITQFVISGEINKYFKARKIMSGIDKLKDHVIICGFGRNGRQATRILRAHSQQFMVIESDAVHIEEHLKQYPDILYLIGNATDDHLLKKAGIEKAKALITTLPDDADNVFIVLSARSLNPDIQIISRASHINSTPKLKKAGANNVIMPDMIGGTHMATLISKPDVIEFIDFLSGEGGESIHIESVDHEQLPEEVKNKSLQEVMAWKPSGVNCIGIKDEEGKFIINPLKETIIKPGMKVIVLGTRLQIGKMKNQLE